MLSPLEKLLFLAVFRSESLTLSVDSLIWKILDQNVYSEPENLILVHARSNWFNRPTIVFYSQRRVSPIPLIEQAAKLEKKRLVRLSCGEGSF